MVCLQCRQNSAMDTAASPTDRNDQNGVEEVNLCYHGEQLAGGVKQISGRVAPGGRKWPASSPTLSMVFRLNLCGTFFWTASLAFGPDGSTLATGSNDGTLPFWSAATGRPHAALRGHWDLVRCVAFSGMSPRGRIFSRWKAAAPRTQSHSRRMAKRWPPGGGLDEVYRGQVCLWKFGGP
jgi:hypothetical protein